MSLLTLFQLNLDIAGVVETTPSWSFKPLARNRTFTITPSVRKIKAQRIGRTFTIPAR